MAGGIVAPPARPGPSRAFYLLAALIFVGSTLIAALLGFSSVRGLFHLTTSYQRAVMPGQAEIVLDQDGDYTIFYEYRSRVDGQRYRANADVPDLDVTLRSTTGGRPIALEPSSSDKSYDTGDFAGTAIYEFGIDQPGSYQVSASYPAGQNGPTFVLAFGQGFTRDLLTRIGATIASVGVCCGGGLLALVLAIVVLVMRSSARRHTTATGVVPRSMASPYSGLRNA